MAGSAASDLGVEAVRASAAAAREIVAAIHLVTSGLAVRVSLTGFALPTDLVREAEEAARTAGCRAIVAIGMGGDLGLVIARAEVEGG